MIYKNEKAKSLHFSSLWHSREFKYMCIHKNVQDVSGTGTSLVDIQPFHKNKHIRKMLQLKRMNKTYSNNSRQV